MKIFIWQGVEQVSGSYHSDGSVVVIASDEAEARMLANKKESCKIEDSEAVDAVYDLVTPESAPIDPCVWIFPNAGCC